MQHQIASALCQRGHQVRAFFLGSPPPPPEPVPYPWHAVPEHPRLLNNVGALAEATESLMATWMPDAAYLSSPESLGVLGRLPGRTGILATSHHPDPPPLPGLTWRLGKAVIEARRLQPFFYERAVLRRAHRRSAVSSYGKEALVERGYLSTADQVEVIHNALEPFWLEPASNRREAGRSGFLFVGRLDPQKGIDVLLEAYRTSATRWPLTIIGAGSERRSLEARAEALGLTDRVTFLGHQSRVQVRQAMEGAGALVAPSRTENYPVVLLEAMAVGLPVLATRVGGVPEMITHLDSGILLHPEDREGLGRALTLVSDDAGLRSRLRAGGTAVAARHEPAEIVDALEEQLRLAVACARGRHPVRSTGPRSVHPHTPPAFGGPSHPRRSLRPDRVPQLAAPADGRVSGRRPGPPG